MRFLISISVVAALALLPAMAQAVCPSASLLKAASDYVLPVNSGLPDLISDCNSVSWTFDFERTAKTTSWTIVNPNITNTTMDEFVHSDDCDPSTKCQISGTDSVTGSPTQRRVDIDARSDKGHFIKMVLDATYFNE